MNRSLRIAVADDEADLRDYFQETLTLLGHQVVCVAKTGRELVSLARSAQIDLIITDIKMPDLDGIDAATEICREQPIPIILVSAYHDSELLARADDSHFLAYLVKPIKQSDLETAIAIVMRRFDQFQTVRQEAADLRQALEDRKLIERAKGILIKRASLTEEEAHKRLTQAARSANQKLVEIAKSVLTADGLLGPGE